MSRKIHFAADKNVIRCTVVCAELLLTMETTFKQFRRSAVEQGLEQAILNQLVVKIHVVLPLQKQRFVLKSSVISQTHNVFQVSYCVK